MGEYFYILNLDKKEFLYPHQLGSGLKLWELCASSASGTLPYLTAQSTDLVEHHKEKGFKLIGHWANDRILTVGDYDKSNLMDIAEKEYRNISLEVREEYERFMDRPLDKRWDING